MKKSLLITTGTLALAGALAGLGAFGGMALAATPTPVSPSTTVVNPSFSGTATAVSALSTSSIKAKSDTEKASAEEKKTPEADKDKVNYQEQGNYQGNNGTPDKAGAASVDTEKKSGETSPSGPDTDNVQVQVQQ